MATRDAQASGANSSSTPINISINIAVGATLCLVEVTGAPAAMSASASGPSRVTGIAIDGNAFTCIYPDPLSGGVIAGEVWALLNPPSGAGKTVAITRLAGGFAPICYAVKTYLGGDSTSLGAALSSVTRQTATSPSSAAYTASVAVTGAVGEITETFCCVASSHTVCATTAGFQTQDGTGTDGNSAELRSGYIVGAGGAVTHSYDLQADAGARLGYLFSLVVRDAPGAGSNPAGVQACLVGEPKLVGGRMAV